MEALPIHAEFMGQAAAGEECRYLTRDKTLIEKHRRAEHNISAERQGRPGVGDARVSKGYVGVRLQTLCSEKKHIDYLIVDASLDKQVLRPKIRRTARQSIDSRIDI